MESQTSPDDLKREIQRAAQHWQAGRVAEAERLLARLLPLEPKDLESLHSLGLLALHLGKVQRGVELLEKGAQLGATADLLINLGVGYRRLGRRSEAERCARQALLQDPHSADAHNNLGNVLRDAGRLADAEQHYRLATQLRPGFKPALQNLADTLNAREKAAEAEQVLRHTLALAPEDPGTFNLLGVALQKLGRRDEAEESYRRALTLNPKLVSALSNLGSVLCERGKLAEAEQVLRHTLTLAPEEPGTFNVLGIALQKLGRRDEAEANYRRALALDPQLVSALNNLGGVLCECGRQAEAEQYLHRAIALQPDCADAYNNLGNMFRETRRLKEAEASHRRALALRPRFASASNNLGNDLHDLGRANEALQCYRDAVAIDSESAEYYSNMGSMLMEMGQLDEALASYRKALELKPDFDAAHSNLIFALDLIEGSDIASQQRARRHWYERHGARHATQTQPHENHPDAHRRLRVGYVSADFRRHSAYYAFAPIIVGHERAAFEVYCYSAVKSEDDATARLKAAAKVWRSTLGMSDDELAKQIRADGIDILVDLSGHSAGSRLLAFARKPAPVQITAWGHATGTGMKTMDYFFADAVAVPAEERGHFAEEVIDLPCSLCYEPPDYLPQLGPLPALAGSPLTYGCVNRLEKITQRTIALWGEIMEGAPHARLLVKDYKAMGDPQMRQIFLDRLRVTAGIEAERVVLAGPSAHAEHLKVFHQIDVGLDPFPQGGGISTAEALWMGVPVVTLLGKTPPSRFTPSILGQLGMTEWVASTGEQYVRIALEAGRDLPRLAALRASLRERLRGSHFGNPERFTRAVERAYRQLWQRWCAKR